jgi:Ni/Co efflux regulator RcnB
MQRRTMGLLGVLAFAALLLQAAPAVADPPRHARAWGHRSHDDHYGRDRHEHHDRYCDHDRDRDYYPRHGYVVERLPRGYRALNYRGDRYYYGGGQWYRPYGLQFVIVAPPAGLIIDSRGISGFVAAQFPLAGW